MYSVGARSYTDQGYRVVGVSTRMLQNRMQVPGSRVPHQVLQSSAVAAAVEA